MRSHAKPRYDWNDIVYFLEVARQRSLVRAASNLKVDHTTVSRRIRELESSLNCILFKRSKSGFTPTETGLRLLQYAEGMENHANSIAEAIGASNAAAGGAVRLASLEGIGISTSRAASEISTGSIHRSLSNSLRTAASSI